MRTATTSAAAAMFLVGTLAAVSGIVNAYPLFGGQAFRYLLSAILLLIASRFYGLRYVRPTSRELALLLALTGTGLVLFNVFVVYATRHTSAATLGTIIGSVPLVLATVGPAVAGRRPSPKVLVAAAVVVAGTAVTSGLGRTDVAGVLLSIGALACEACFTLLAIPLLARLGPIRVSAYTATLAVPLFLAVGAVVEPEELLRKPTLAEIGGFAYLAVVVGAGAFLLWYSAMPRLGADRAGLFAGMIPIGAITTSAVVGLGLPTFGELAGAAIVVAGLVIGLAPSSGRRDQRSTGPSLRVRSAGSRGS
ncbi:DMT family transporter [Kribbella sp. NPDC056951]|uniref:DMT family transporter n=1 Tax=Kribbella sp. NPDC056951 TaxID=3345978 RepID=UPI00362BFAAF